VSRLTDRQQQLLADRALEGLAEAEALELHGLGGAGDESFDVAAAAVALADLGAAEPMPEALAARVLSGARRRTPGGPAEVEPPGGTSMPARREGPAAARARRRWGLGPSSGWITAVAATLLAVLAWNRPPRVVEKLVTVEVPAPRPRPPTAAERRAELLAQAPDARTIGWAATPDPAATGASGDVVWSGSGQQGFMRIRGLAPNDPARAQYQLWIFDGRRDQAHPVDGGVFDVQAGEVVVPIRAAIRVFDPRLFAVTVERPGGVVVSKRERIVLTAAL